MAGGLNTTWLPRAATILAVLSCYGTTAAVSLLSLLGVSLAIHEGAWAVAIGVLTALAALAVAASSRRHRRFGPVALAALGLALVLWAMFGSYSWTIELAGFVLLVAAALWDWRLGAAAGAAAQNVSWIEPGDLADRLAGDAKPAIVDVRGPDEFTGPLGHIAAAANLPMPEIANRLRDIDALRAEPVVLVCRTDRRSAAAATLLRDAGFRHVHVLRGGMEAWNRIGLPVEGRMPPPQS